jgi:hypothetical protein
MRSATPENVVGLLGDKDGSKSSMRASPSRLAPDKNPLPKQRAISCCASRKSKGKSRQCYSPFSSAPICWLCLQKSIVLYLIIISGQGPRPLRPPEDTAALRNSFYVFLALHHVIVNMIVNLKVGKQVLRYSFGLSCVRMVAGPGFILGWCALSVSTHVGE